MNPVKHHSPRRTSLQWQDIVEAQKASGLSAPKYCKENGVSYASFINWKKKLSSHSEPNNKTDSVPTFIELTAEPEQTPPLVSEDPDSTTLNVELDLGSGIHLRIRRAG